jgi:hypothetical protein
MFSSILVGITLGGAQTPESLGEVSDLATKADIAELKADIRAELNTQFRWMIGTMIGVAPLGGSL